MYTCDRHFLVHHRRMCRLQSVSVSPGVTVHPTSCFLLKMKEKRYSTPALSLSNGRNERASVVYIVTHAQRSAIGRCKPEDVVFCVASDSCKASRNVEIWFQEVCRKMAVFYFHKECSKPIVIIHIPSALNGNRISLTIKTFDYLPLFLCLERMKE